MLLFNLLIAIFSNTYEEMSKRSNMEYALIVYGDYYAQKFEKKYSFMVSLPPPFNILTCIFFPIMIFFSKTPKIHNFFLITVHFCFVLLPCYCLFLVFGIISIPFSYIKILFDIFKLESKATEISSKLRI